MPRLGPAVELQSPNSRRRRPPPARNRKNRVMSLVAEGFPVPQGRLFELLAAAERTGDRPGRGERNCCAREPRLGAQILGLLRSSPLEEYRRPSGVSGSRGAAGLGAPAHPGAGVRPGGLRRPPPSGGNRARLLAPQPAHRPAQPEDRRAKCSRRSAEQAYFGGPAARHRASAAADRRARRRAGRPRAFPGACTTIPRWSATISAWTTAKWGAGSPAAAISPPGWPTCWSTTTIPRRPPRTPL